MIEWSVMESNRSLKFVLARQEQKLTIFFVLVCERKQKTLLQRWHAKKDSEQGLITLAPSDSSFVHWINSCNLLESMSELQWKKKTHTVKNATTSLVRIL